MINAWRLSISVQVTKRKGACGECNTFSPVKVPKFRNKYENLI